MVADPRRSAKGKLWQDVVSQIRMVDSTIPHDLEPEDRPQPVIAKGKPYARSEAEQARVDALQAKQALQCELPRWTAVESANGVVDFGPQHPDRELAIVDTMTALGFTSEAAFWTYMHSILELCRIEDGFDEDRFNRLLGVVASFQPKDELEALAAYQVIILQDLETEVASNPAADVFEADKKVAQLLKIMSSQAQMIDKLKKYRTSGPQVDSGDHIHFQQNFFGIQPPQGVTSSEVGDQRVIEQPRKAFKAPEKRSRQRKAKSSAKPVAQPKGRSDER